MKRILFPILFFVLIFTSCSLFFQEEYGTITIDLEGGKARSINSSTGLPNLADSELEIDIVTDGNSSIYKKILASEPKFFQADFPIGSRLEITVKLNGPSSSWSAHNSHTVKEGNNDIRLLLNKNASSLANVGFSTAAVVNKYEFNIAGKRIDINSRELPVFTRDSRGRLYIAYKDINWKLNRYESDGTPNNFASDSPILTTITGASSVNLASDPVTGKVYALIKDSSNNVVLYRIKDDGSVIAGNPTIPAGPIAVYNNNLFALGVSAVSGNNPLKMFTITEVGSGLTLNQAGSTVSVSTRQIIISGTPINVDFKDILVKKDKIYILFAKNNLPIASTPSPYYSLGGMLEYTYNSSGITNHPQKYGFNDTVTAGDDIVTAGEANFYGPACFIGYDEQSISIADDGCTFKKEGGSVRIYKNVNRIFSFNTSTKSLYSYATENKWFKEYEVTGGSTPPPGTGKVLLWEKNSDPGTEGFKFYLVDENNISASLPSAAFLQDNGSDYPTDVFCYDQEGNLYVVWFDTPSYYVRRYEKANNYSTDNTKDNQQKMVNNSGYTQLSASEKPTAIAVDVSDSANGYVYYSYKTGEKVIIRNKWIKLNGFKTGSYLNKHTLNDLSGANDSKITSMTVNNDGLFVAQKNEYISPKKFKNVIHKYSDFEHPNTDYIGDTSSTIPHNTGDNYVDENIFAMQIINGVLYYTVIKQDGQLENQNTNIVKTSAKLVKSRNSLNNAMNYQSFDTVWSTQSSSTDGYAPYRFIGTVPNKLIIASDGYYGIKTPNEVKNKNKVLSFDITTSTNWTVTPTDTNATFSRELTYGASGFEWE